MKLLQVLFEGALTSTSNELIHLSHHEANKNACTAGTKKSKYLPITFTIFHTGSGWGRPCTRAVLSLLSRCGVRSSRLSGPVVVAHPLLDVVQLGLQILAPALLHPVIWRL